MSVIIGRILPRAALIGVVAVTVAWTLGTAVDSVLASRSGHFWSNLWFDGASSPHYDSLGEMELASGAVVLGRIVRVDEGRVFGDPHPDNPKPEDELVAYVTATIEVDRVLSGALEEPSSKSIKLELPMPQREALGELVGDGPGEPAVFFIFNAGTLAAEQGRPQAVQKIEREYYSLIAFGAVVRNLGGKAQPVDAPELEFLADFQGEPFDSFLERISPAR